MIRVATALLALLCASSVAAQTVAITGGRVIPMGGSGDLARGTVIVRDGRIAEVGPDVDIPSGAPVIIAHGQNVTQGLVQPGTALAMLDALGAAACRERESQAYNLPV